MNRHQTYLLGLLKEIDAICKKHGIQYFLVGGSLIGAVRNHGFLPWDDDADVVMTYDNFRKFKKACETDLPPKRMLCAPDVQESYSVLIPRYISLETTVIHAAQSLHNDYAGEVIDIFLLDPVADDQASMDAYVANVAITHDMVSYSSAASPRYDVPLETYQKYENIRQKQGKLAACQLLEKERAQYFDEGGSRYMFRWQGCLISYPRAWFQDAAMVEFEGQQFPAPIGINEYLTAYFGEEWAQVPQHINPTKHDSTLSLDFPYTEALEYYKPSTSREELLELVWTRKHVSLETAAQANRLSDEIAKAQAKRIQLELEKHLASVGEEFDAAYGQRDGVTLAKLLGAYLRDQTDRALIGRHAYDGIYRYRKPVMAQVTDRVFEAALWAFMETERIRFARRFLSIRKQAGRPLSAAMREAENDIELYNEARNSLAHGDADVALVAAEQLCERNPKVGAFFRLKCDALSAKQKAGDEQARAAFALAVAYGREHFAWDGYFVKLEGDMLWEQGRKSEAREKYLVAAENTRDGFALLDIHQRTGYWPSWMRSASWAAEAGIPQWEGELPDVTLPRAPFADGANPTLSHKNYLYGLLKEVAKLCDDNDIGYALSPEAYKALVKYKALPDTLDAYSIVCTKAGMAKLEKAVRNAKLSNRAVERVAKDKRFLEGALLYCGTDSLCLQMDANEPRAVNGLYVVIAPVDCVAAKPLKMNEGVAEKALRKLKEKVAPSAAEMPKTKTVADGVSGHKFKVAKSLKAKGKRPTGSMRYLYDEVVSTEIDQAAFMATGVVAPDFFDRMRSLKKKKRIVWKADVLFDKNFREVKFAVQLKQVAFDLLPRKAEIKALTQAGDKEALAEILKNHKRVAKSFKGVGDLNFDSDIYAALMSLGK